MSFGDEVRNVRASRQPPMQTFLAVRHPWKARESCEASEALENVRGRKQLVSTKHFEGPALLLQFVKDFLLILIPSFSLKWRSKRFSLAV